MYDVSPFGQPSVNTYLGVELGIQLAEHLVVMQEDLADPLRQLGADVRWTPADQLRVLLKDFGPLTGGQRKRLEELLRAYAKAARTFSFSVGHIAFSPSESVPRRLIARIEDSSGLLQALRDNIEKAAFPIGFQQDRVSWEPRILIGRVTTEHRPPDLREVLNRWQGRILGHTDCQELVFFEVRRQGMQARTRILSRIELGSGR